MGVVSPDLDHGQAGLDEAADVLADLSVGLGRLSEVVPHLLVGLVQDALLLVGGAPRRAAPGTQPRDCLENFSSQGLRSESPDKPAFNIR